MLGQTGWHLIGVWCRVSRYTKIALNINDKDGHINADLVYLVMGVKQGMKVF